MDIPTIRAWPREERGTRACRRLRRRGLVPAVLYGRGEANVLLTVRADALQKLLAEHSVVLRVDWDGRQEPVQIREVQYDALGDYLVHADFDRISLSETVRITVPIETHGEAEGVKQGGVLDVLLHEIDVECLPTAIPEKLRVEVAAVNVGDDLRLRDVPLPDGVVAIGDPEEVVLTVVRPTVIEEEAPEQEAVMAEPEVIGKPAEGAEAPAAQEGEAEKQD